MHIKHTHQLLTLTKQTWRIFGENDTRQNVNLPTILYKQQYLLRDKGYVDLIKNTINDTVNNNRNIDDVLLWEIIKMQIRGNSIKYSSRKKGTSNNILSALQKRLKRLKENFDEDPNFETEHDIHF